MYFLLFRKGIVGYQSATDVGQRNLVAFVPTRVDNPNMRTAPHTSQSRIEGKLKIFLEHNFSDFCFSSARANITRLNLALRLTNALLENKSEQSKEMSFKYS